MTHFWCGGPSYYYLCQISSGFCVPEIIKIRSFFTPDWFVHRVKRRRFETRRIFRCNDHVGCV